MNKSIQKQDVEAIFQQIISLSLKNDAHFYLIYQTNDQNTSLTDLITGKELTLFRYINYQIKHTPGLIELDLKNEEDQIILKQSIQEFYLAIDPKTVLFAKPRSVYGWIYSSFNAEVLAQELGKIAIQPSSDGKQLLRYFDPSVLPPLLNIFILAQKEILLKPVHSWLYLNSDGHLIIEKNPLDERHNLIGNLGIIDQQWEQISWIESRNQTLARYHFFHPQYNLSEREADDIIMQSFQDATLKGYHDKRDLTEYAYRSLVIHPKFIKHPIIAEAIRRHRHQSLIKQLQTITPPQWDIVADECIINTKEINNGFM
ncbi:hypothetical protein A9G34_05935 [Gilliamella sp. Choc4-2]|uniref:hypothetical protein n=1 Tax=unclassified Gilliamella TaxID=2685620 RepID=UPI00080EAC8E|nr:hypothetical protein [Gilliamella apicola]OCG32940.1 hypothetical protein A9G33_02060 [Gilliamella apicola]OCG45488.1 hypothetical protein A9G34_05935 [Gilliamella apicola]OCG56412.1 hypothetical protein A9G36_03570 [Gilliamella apicola]